jgi:hypothetical protein
MEEDQLDNNLIQNRASEIANEGLILSLFFGLVREGIVSPEQAKEFIGRAKTNAAAILGTMNEKNTDFDRQSYIEALKIYDELLESPQLNI